MKRSYVYIDDGYLSKVLKEFGQGKYVKIDYNQFAITLAKSLGLWCGAVYFYTAPPFQGSPPTADESRRRSGYDHVIYHLRRIPGFNVREGRVQNIDGEFKQKGVDTLLTMDLMRHPTDNIPAILVICDTDFVPILNEMRSRGIEVILYYYNDYVRGSKFSMSNYLLTACDRSVLLTKEMVFRSRFLPWEERHPEAKGGQKP